MSRKISTHSGEVINLPERLPKGLQYLYAECENFKGLEKYKIDINGRSFFVTGANSFGKSAILQMLQASTDVEYLPTEPTKQGEDNSRFRVVVGGTVDGERQVYVIEGFFPPHIEDKTKSEILKGYYQITNEAGEKLPTTQKAMAQFFGAIFVDPLKFCNLSDMGEKGKQEQIKILKNLSGRGKEIDIIFAEIDALKKEKSEINAVIKSDEGALKNFESKFTPEDIKKYQKEQPLEPIQKEMEEVSKKLQEWNRISDGIDTFKKDLETYRQSIVNVDTIDIPKIEGEKSRINTEIERLRQEIERQENLLKDCDKKIMDAKTGQKEIQTTAIPGIEEKIAKGEQWIAKTPKPNIEEVSQKMTDAQLHNRRFAEIQDFSKLSLKIRNNKAAVEKKDADISGKKADADKIIAESQIPVKGLTFTSEGIYYNDIPFDSSTINKAERIKVGIRIGVAANPTLKSVFVEAGSELDKHSWKEIYDFCNENGIQIIAELVDFNAGELTHKYIEEIL